MKVGCLTTRSCGSPNLSGMKCLPHCCASFPEGEVPETEILNGKREGGGKEEGRKGGEKGGRREGDTDIRKSGADSGFVRPDVYLVGRGAVFQNRRLKF